MKAFILGFILSGSLLASPSHDLLPAPKSFNLKASRAKAPERLLYFSNLKDERLESGLKLLEKSLKADFYPASFLDSFLKVTVKERGGQVQGPEEKEDYTLNISSHEVLLSASTVLGALRGLETLKQLARQGENGFSFPEGLVIDQPRFSWRGLLLDVSRHFFSIKAIKRQVDAMAAVKMNVLHLHLTDDQGFRVESKRFPLLHLMGSNGLYYTQEQLKDLIEHARKRGVRIVPEFDVPGHATSWLVGYPRLASLQKNYVLSKVYGVHDAAMDPSREETYEFLEEFFEEMARLFPDEYMHFGGDEVTGKHWEANPRIKEFMRQNGLSGKRELQALFTSRLASILDKLGKKSLGWDEVLDGKPPPQVNIQVWRSPRYLKQAVAQGRKAIFSYGYYLDHQLSSSVHYQVDPIEDWNLSQEEEKLVLGGEACMWTERVNEALLDSRVWPRTAAIAERLWSPSSQKNNDDMLRRLRLQSARLEKLGLNHRRTLPEGLRRLSKLGASLEALARLAEVLEPGKFYSQHAYRDFKVDTKLDRLADYLPSRSQEASDLERLVDHWLSHKDERSYHLLYEKFNVWKRNHSRFKNSLGEDERLRELLTLSKNLFTLSWVAQEALYYINSGKPAGEIWESMNLHRLDRINEMQAGCEMALVPAVKKLILAANSEPQFLFQAQ